MGILRNLLTDQKRGVFGVAGEKRGYLYSVVGKMASVREIKIVRSESLGHRSEVSSPEAKVGMRVEDLWDEQKPQLSPDEKLNACFESIPVSAFPLSSDSQGNMSLESIPVYF